MKRKVQLEERLFPLQALFNGLHDRDFIPRMQGLANGIGFDCNTTGCLVPEEGEELPVKGYITFYTPHDEVTISNEEFLHHMNLIFSNYIQGNPEQADVAEKTRQMMRNRFAADRR